LWHKSYTFAFNYLRIPDHQELKHGQLIYSVVVVE